MGKDGFATLELTARGFGDSCGSTAARLTDPTGYANGHVYVSVYRGVGRGRCRFLLPSGRLSRPRACTRPIEFRARGTAQWRISRRIHIRPGRYWIRADAVDGLHRHLPRSAASVTQVRVH